MILLHHLCVALLLVQKQMQLQLNFALQLNHQKMA
jgi:hypothetical protein